MLTPKISTTFKLMHSFTVHTKRHGTLTYNSINNCRQRACVCTTTTVDSHLPWCHEALQHFLDEETRRLATALCNNTGQP